MSYDLVDPSSVNDQIAVTGALTLSGTNLLAINPTNPPFGLGAYTLMTYGTLSGNAANLQMTGAWANSRYTFGFDTSVSPNVVLNVGGSPPASLTWSGDGSANLWDLKTSTNWNSNTEMFYSMDTVTFDNTSTNPVVNLVGTLMPASVTLYATANSYTFSGSGKISGVAGLVNNYSGTLTILTTNDYTGATTINAGTLLVNGALGNTVVTVNSGATLGGTGVILGPVTVASGGTLSPGAPSGTLAISNSLVLAAGSTSVFAADLDTLAEASVVGLSKVTYGGTLSLALSGRAPVASDTFKLFSATTYAGAFASISPAAPGANLAWNTNTLAADGTLRIVSLAPPNIGVQVAGNQLSLSWPSGNTGWYLQAQTNSIGVGLSTNWVDVPGSITTNFVIMTLNPTNGSVFYRLIAP